MVYYCIYDECPFWAGRGGVEVGGEPGGVYSVILSLDAEEVDATFEWGRLSLSIPIGGDRLPSQIKSQVSFVRAVVMGLGMPCALARNWVMPPMVSCMIRALASRVGWVDDQMANLDLILSRIISQGVASSKLLPIHEPRQHIAWPSCAMQIPSCRGGVSGVDLVGCSYTVAVVLSPNGEHLGFLEVEFGARHKAPAEKDGL